MSLQRFFSLDLLMDLSMLLTVQLAYGSMRPLRFFLAAGLLFICTLFVASVHPASSFIAGMHLPVFILAAGIATGERRPARILETAACMFLTGAVSAGLYSLGNGMAALFGLPMLLFLLRSRRHESFRWNIEVYVERNGLHASLPALIDTGNRLREHCSGLPVFIAEASAMPQIAELAYQLPPEEIHTLPFGVLGSTGEINCFLPDKLEILVPGKGNIPAPPCWVAIYPGRIPGSTRALAPPAFIKVLEARRSILFKRKSIE